MPVEEVFPSFLMVEENKKLARELLPLCNKYTEMTTNNCLHIENFPSTLYDKEFERQVMEEPVVKDAFDFIIKNYLQTFLNHRGIGLPTNLKPFGFFSSMEKYAYLRKHCHLDCLFSGIIYLEVGENVPPLILYDSKPVRNFVNYPVDPNLNVVDFPLKVIPPKEGLFLLWDSYLEHEVPQKMNNNPRKTFVFNL